MGILHPNHPSVLSPETGLVVNPSTTSTTTEVIDMSLSRTLFHKYCFWILLFLSPSVSVEKARSGPAPVTKEEGVREPVLNQWTGVG